ncbi:MAG: YHS domain-containing protein [Nitrososphaeraceae archaeon]
MAKDPVCGMNVDEPKTQYISEINGQKVFFCREVCQREFDKNPKKYGY